MIRLATPDDIPALKDFLRRHLDTSMFLLGNLDAHGLNTTSHRHSTTYVLRVKSDQITGVFGATQAGYLTCQMPDLTRDEALACCALIPGYQLRGMSGDATQVAGFIDAFPISRGGWDMNVVQPLYALSLSDLPKSTAQIRRAQNADRQMLEEWFAGYLRDTGLANTAVAVDDVAVRAAAAVGSEDLRLLIGEDGNPVAMSDLNARAGEVVQIGGVYVPPELRGQGFAGRVVAAQLQGVRSQGVTRAILFAASTDAARAYEKIGFRHIGRYRVALLRSPVTLDPAAPEIDTPEPGA